jgi:hypothetical protein
VREPEVRHWIKPLAGLYNPEQQADPASWQTFTNKFMSAVHSLSVVEIDRITRLGKAA